MKTEITKELLRLLEQKLTAMGYTTKERPEHERYGTLKDIYKGDEWIAAVIPNGLGFPQVSHLQEEQSKLTDFFIRLREMYYLYKEAKPLPFESISDYRLVSSFGDSLLAVKMNKNNDFIFTTWDYDFDRKGVSYGHYYETDYEGAKQDFLYRAELLEKRKELSHEERGIIYDSLVYRGLNDSDITFEEEQLLKKLTDKIAEDLPKQEIQKQEPEQEIER